MIAYLKPLICCCVFNTFDISLCLADWVHGGPWRLHISSVYRNILRLKYDDTAYGSLMTIGLLSASPIWYFSIIRSYISFMDPVKTDFSNPIQVCPQCFYEYNLHGLSSVSHYKSTANSCFKRPEISRQSVVLSATRFHFQSNIAGGRWYWIPSEVVIYKGLDFLSRAEHWTSISGGQKLQLFQISTRCHQPSNGSCFWKYWFFLCIHSGKNKAGRRWRGPDSISIQVDSPLSMALCICTFQWPEQKVVESAGSITAQGKSPASWRCNRL